METCVCVGGCGCGCGCGCLGKKSIEIILMKSRPILESYFRVHCCLQRLPPKFPLILKSVHFLFRFGILYV